VWSNESKPQTGLSKIKGKAPQRKDGKSEGGRAAGGHGFRKARNYRRNAVANKFVNKTACLLGKAGAKRESDELTQKTREEKRKEKGESKERKKKRTGREQGQGKGGKRDVSDQI